MPKSKNYSDPDLLARIARLRLQAHRVIEGTLSGLHRSPLHGLNVEFSSYRQYAPGDDLRRLDWRVLGRTDRYYVKQFEDESNLRATMVIDASASMSYASGVMTKFDYAATLSVALVRLLVLQHDAVGLLLCDDRQGSPLIPAATEAQVTRITQQLEQTTPRGQTDLGSILKSLADQVPPRGMVIVLSDLFTDISRLCDGLARLRFSGHDVLVFHILDRDELLVPFDELVLFRDIEGSEEIFAEPATFRKAYQAAMQQFLAEVQQQLGSRGAEHVLFVTDENPADAICHYLHRRSRAARATADAGSHKRLH